MKSHAAILLALQLIFATTAGAADLARLVRERIDAYETAVRANTQRIIDAQTEEERARHRAAIPAADPYAAEVLRLIESHPDDSGLVEGLNWLVTQCLHLPAGKTALDLIATRYADRAGLAPAIKRLEDTAPEQSAPVLEAVLAQNQHPEERAAATFALGRQQLAVFESTPDTAARETARTRAAALLESVLTTYPEVSIQGSTLADQAAALLFEMTHLSPGATAPEISGTDHQDKPFQLSDYRGRHVILVFWGDWCHGCHGLQPALAEIAARHQHKPLAILGVNTDDRVTARKALAASTLPWRCWLDGSTSGPITREWNLRHFPTIYLISPDGVILAKDASIPALAQALDHVLSS